MNTLKFLFFVWLSGITGLMVWGYGALMIRHINRLARERGHGDRTITKWWVAIMAFLIGGWHLLHALCLILGKICGVV